MLLRSARSEGSGLVTITISGPLVASNSAALRAASGDLPADATVLALNLVAVDALDEAGLGALVAVLRQARHIGARVLVRGSRVVEQRLARAGLMRFVDVA